MIILRIEHAVPNFQGWKKAFDNDPLDRKKSGVRRYRISRPVDDPNYLIVDLEFDDAQQAEAMLSSLRKLWGQVEGTIIAQPHARVFNVLETREY